MTDQYLLKQFGSLLKKRHAHLRTWASKNSIEAYRVYHRHFGSIPLLIDIYGKYLHVVQLEQNEVPFPEAVALDFVEAAGRALYIPEDRIYYKYRQRLKDKQQYTKYASEGVWHEISEYGLTFRVNLADYIDTGLFLDHRDTRQMVGENAAGTHILNLFAYTGAFSVYAAAGGALSTTTVDLSGVYLDWARRNMKINGFISPVHEYVNEDVFQYLEQALNTKRRWDLIILDPPTFSNSRKMDRVLDVQKDHLSLIQDSMKLLTKKGAVLFSTNSAKFGLDTGITKKYSVRELTNKTMPEDFVGTKVHQCWLITR